MQDIIKICFDNLFPFDWIILVLAGANYFVFYRKAKAKINQMYQYFHFRDHTSNLSHASKQVLQASTKPEPSLTGNDLLEIRESMNFYYALFSNLTAMFPLMGMLGTILSLIPMVNAIGTESTGLFFSALTSTLWGILCALFFKALDSFISYKIEDNEKHMEYLLNPTSTHTQEYMP